MLSGTIGCSHATFWARDHLIVVVGQPLYLLIDGDALAVGLPARIALASAARGRAVQLVGKAGEDPEGDAVVLALAEGGVGHVALRRDGGMPTLRAPMPMDVAIDATGADLDAPTTSPEPAMVDHSAVATLDAADVELALRYLTEFSVVVLGDPADGQVVRAVAAATAWAGAKLIVLMPSGSTVPEALPADAIVFEAPDEDPDGVFAAMVGTFAAALDEGDDPAVAFRSIVAAEGWTPATGAM